MHSAAGISPRLQESLNQLVDGLRTGRVGLLAYVDELQRRFASWEPRIHAFVPEEGRFERLVQSGRRSIPEKA